ncbi:MAG: hypothetical protein AAGU27_20115 [Dehalobacterium sp.]
MAKQEAISFMQLKIPLTVKMLVGTISLKYAGQTVLNVLNVDMRLIT